ncbi:MAG TPA: nucleotide exchange factor GrpE [Limnochordales bacterium]
MAPDDVRPTEQAPVSGDGASAEATRAALAAALERIGTLEGQIRRLMADLEMVRRRSRAEAERMADEAVERMTGPLLSAVDDLDRALAAVPDDPRWSSVATGIRMVHQKLLTALEQAGIRAVTAQGAAFDPALHQAVEAVPVEDPSQDGQVLEEVRRGFTLRGRVLRPAMVKVGVYRRSEAAPEAPSQTQSESQEGIAHG